VASDPPEAVFTDRHSFDGADVVCKRALSKEEQKTTRLTKLEHRMRVVRADLSTQNVFSESRKSLSECQDLLTKHVFAVGSSESCPLLRSFGRVLAQDVLSNVDLPEFPTSILDGFAVQGCAEIRPWWRISGTCFAGDTHSCILRNDFDAFYVATGARIPEGADCVIPIEYCSVDADFLRIKDDYLLEVGSGIRWAGSDTARNSVILKTGSLIGPGEFGLFNACKVSEVLVIRKLRIGILSTGSEIVTGQVEDANKAYLMSRLSRFPDMAEVTELQTAVLSDDKEVFAEMIRGSDHDVIISTGSVSKGRTDFMKEVLSELDFDILFGQVDLKPGKPTTVAVSKAKKQIVFALPGNPASCFVTFNILVLPAIEKMLGRSDYELQRTNVRLLNATTIQPDLERPEYLRAVASISTEGHLHATLVDGHQRSSRVASCSGNVNCLVRVNPGKSPIFVPETVFECFLLRGTSLNVQAGSNSYQSISTKIANEEIPDTIKAKAFDTLVEWLKLRTDVQNIDLMNLAGFCRNCLSKWVCGGSHGEVSLDQARNYVYGMHYEKWKELYRKGEKQQHGPRIPDTAPVTPTPTHNPCASSLMPMKGNPYSTRVVAYVLTVSDRAHAGVYPQDESGKTIEDMLNASGIVSRIMAKRIVSDDGPLIQQSVKDWISQDTPSLIITTGGTGFTARDVTPESIMPLLSRMAHGLIHLLLSSFVAKDPMFALSRPVIGMAGKTLIITLPGRPAAVKDGLTVLLPVIPKVLEDLDR
jgi:molybdenum cofactor synthesis domain-containing protein